MVIIELFIKYLTIYKYEVIIYFMKKTPNTLKDQVQQLNRVKDCFWEHDSDIMKTEEFLKLKKAFIAWLKRDPRDGDSLDFEYFLECDQINESTQLQAAKSDAVYDFMQFVRLENFHDNIVGEKDGFRIKVSFLSPEVRNELTKKYKKIKKKFLLENAGYSMIQHELNQIFEHHCCSGKDKHYNHPKHHKFEKMCYKLYQERYPDLMKITDTYGKEHKKALKELSNVIQFEKFGNFTIIEAFKKGSVNQLVL